MRYALIVLLLLASCATAPSSNSNTTGAGFSGSSVPAQLDTKAQDTLGDYYAGQK